MDLHTILLAGTMLAIGALIGAAALGWLTKHKPAALASAEAVIEVDLEAVKTKIVTDALSWLTDTAAEQRVIAAAQASIARRQVLAQHVVAQLGAPSAAPVATTVNISTAAGTPTAEPDVAGTLAALAAAMRQSKVT